jgi:hypothetical protein
VSSSGRILEKKVENRFRAYFSNTNRLAAQQKYAPDGRNQGLFARVYKVSQRSGDDSIFRF